MEAVLPRLSFDDESTLPCGFLWLLADLQALRIPLQQLVPFIQRHLDLQNVKVAVADAWYPFVFLFLRMIALSMVPFDDARFADSGLVENGPKLVNMCCDLVMSEAVPADA
jgi:hypothetical protein